MNEHRPSDEASPKAMEGSPSKSAARRAAPKIARHEGISPTFVLHAVRRWWKIAATLGILLAVLTAGTVFQLFEKKYVAVGRLQILEEQPYIAFPQTDSKGRQFVQTQLQLLHLPPILLPVLADPVIGKHPEILGASDRLAYLSEKLVAKAIGESVIYSIEYEAADPQRAKEVVDAVIKSYMDYVDARSVGFRQTLLKSLQDEIASRKVVTQRLREDLEEKSTKAGISPTPILPGIGVVGDVGNPIRDLRAFLVQADVDIVLLTARIESEKKMASTPVEITEADVDRLIGSDLLKLKQQLESKRQQIETLKAAATNKSSPVLQQQLSALKADEEAYAKLESQIRAEARLAMGNSAGQQSAARIAELESQLAEAKATQVIVDERLKKEEAKFDVSIPSQLQVEFANRELLQAESVYEVLSQKKAQLSTEGSAPSRVIWLDALNGGTGVILPQQPVKSLPLREMLLAIAISFCAPFGLAIGWEWTLKRVNDVDEIKNQAGMPILGEIAALPTYGYGRRDSRRSHVSRHLFEESVDGLRTTLVLSDSMRHVQVLAIASAVSSEGKTSVATHLAMSLARTTGKPILLIDGDLRAPDIHRMFDVGLSPGLAEVLNDDNSLEQAVTQSEFPLLDLLPAGLLATNPHRLLHNGAFRALLDTLREKYGYIVIDTPPVLAASESLVLAKHADATVLCAMRDRTRMTHIHQAHARLEAAGARTIGVVMSGLPVRNYASRYGSYSYGKTPRHA